MLLYRFAIKISSVAGTCAVCIVMRKNVPKKLNFIVGTNHILSDLL